MIRLKVRVDNNLFERFYSKYTYEPKIETWFRGDIKSYRYNFKIFTQGGSFWMGYLHNSEKLTHRKHFLVIEFNPNKVSLNDYIFLDILSSFFSGDYEIVSYDWCVDLDVDINNVFYVRNGKHLVKVFDYGNSNKTIYIGQGSGRVKIYNKAIEQGIKDKIWTRVEFSIISNILRKNVVFYRVNLKLPEIYILDQIPIIEDLTLRALFWAVINGYSIDDLSRVYRDKIKGLMGNISPLRVDFDIIRDDLINLVDYLSSLIKV